MVTNSQGFKSNNGIRSIVPEQISINKLQKDLIKYQTPDYIIDQIKTLNAEYSLYLENNKFTALCFAILDQAIQETSPDLLPKLQSPKPSHKFSHFIEKQYQDFNKYSSSYINKFQVEKCEQKFQQLLKLIQFQKLDQQFDSQEILENLFIKINTDQEIKLGMDYYIRGILLYENQQNNTNKILLKNITITSFKYTIQQFYDCLSRYFSRQIVDIYITSHKKQLPSSPFFEEYPKNTNKYLMQKSNTIYFIEVLQPNGNNQFYTLYKPNKQQIQKELQEKMQQLQIQQEKQKQAQYNSEYKQRYQSQVYQRSPEKPRNPNYQQPQYIQQIKEQKEKLNRQQQQQYPQQNQFQGSPVINRKSTQQQMQSTFNKCEICGNLFKKNQGFTNRCQHLYCHKCLITEYNQQNMRIVCFNPYCKSQIDIDEIENYFIQQSMAESQELNSSVENQFKCFTCNEQTQIQITKNQTADFFKCQNCKHVNCLKHNQDMQKCFCQCPSCGTDVIKQKLQYKFCEKCNIAICQKCTNLAIEKEYKIENILKPECLSCIEKQQNDKVIRKIAQDNCSICFAQSIEKLQKNNCGHYICKMCKYNTFKHQNLKRINNDNSQKFNQQNINVPQYCQLCKSS